MIDALDEALRDFLLRELPVNNGEIDIVFDQPKREWSARLSRPTLNLFLRDIRENGKLRAPHPVFNSAANGDRVLLTRAPVHLDLYYVVTAWATDPLDEHRILARTLAAFLRYRSLPEDILTQHITDQTAAIALKIAQYDEQSSPNDLWSVMDNDLRPYVDLVATAQLYPYSAMDLPLVRKVEITTKQLPPAR